MSEPITALSERQSEPRTVWVVEPVGDDCYGFQGIFATLEGAKASCPSYEWRQDSDGDWVTVADAVFQHYTLYEEEIGP